MVYSAVLISAIVILASKQDPEGILVANIPTIPRPILG